jgi:hypothetical protein
MGRERDHDPPSGAQDAEELGQNMRVGENGKASMHVTAVKLPSGQGNRTASATTTSTVPFSIRSASLLRANWAIADARSTPATRQGQPRR